MPLIRAGVLWFLELNFQLGANSLPLKLACISMQKNSWDFSWVFMLSVNMTAMSMSNV